MPFSRARHLEVTVSLDGRRYTRCLLSVGWFDLGQLRTNEIVIDEPSISARHARLMVEEDGAVYLQDTGSANGSYVNGEPADEPIILVPEALVQVGSCQLELRELSPWQG